MADFDIEQINAIIAQAVADAVTKTKEEDAGLRSRIQEERTERVERNRQDRRRAGERPPSKIPDNQKRPQPDSKVETMTSVPPNRPSNPTLDAEQDINSSGEVPPPPPGGTVVWGSIDGVLQWIETEGCDSASTS
jgi:hypothetical protein